MIYRIKADGTGLRKVWGGRSDEYSQTISRVSWSPGGSEILFVTDGVYVVRTDGTGLRRLVNLRRIGGPLESSRGRGNRPSVSGEAVCVPLQQLDSGY